MKATIVAYSTLSLFIRIEYDKTILLEEDKNGKVFADFTGRV
jgi:hypothetical protein